MGDIPHKQTALSTFTPYSRQHKLFQNLPAFHCNRLHFSSGYFVQNVDKSLQGQAAHIVEDINHHHHIHEGLKTRDTKKIYKAIKNFEVFLRCFVLISQQTVTISLHNINQVLFILTTSRDGSGGIETRLLWNGRQRNRGSVTSKHKKLFSKVSMPVLRPAQQTTQWAAGLKRPVGEYDHTPPSTYKARNERRYTFTCHMLSIRVQTLCLCNGDKLCPQRSTEKQFIHSELYTHPKQRIHNKPIQRKVCIYIYIYIL